MARELASETEVYNLGNPAIRMYSNVLPTANKLCNAIRAKNWGCSVNRSYYGSPTLTGAVGNPTTTYSSMGNLIYENVTGTQYTGYQLVCKEDVARDEGTVNTDSKTIGYNISNFTITLNGNPSDVNSGIAVQWWTSNGRVSLNNIKVALTTSTTSSLALSSFTDASNYFVITGSGSSVYVILLEGAYAGSGSFTKTLPVNNSSNSCTVHISGGSGSGSSSTGGYITPSGYSTLYLHIACEVDNGGCNDIIYNIPLHGISTVSTKIYKYGDTMPSKYFWRTTSNNL